MAQHTLTTTLPYTTTFRSESSKSERAKMVPAKTANTPATPGQPTELLNAKWGWACRTLDLNAVYGLSKADDNPEPGDVVLVRVQKVRNHTRVTSSQNMRTRIYEGDLIVGVLGNRYATDAFEAEVNDLDHLSMLTNAGMIGSVISKNTQVKKPTTVSFVGYVTNEQGQRVNLKENLFHAATEVNMPNPIVLAVGSGMNSGKTTAVAKLVRALTQQGVNVAACKLTGSISTNDYQELLATGANYVTDFSDYGFPSTYLVPRHEVRDLFKTMMTDVAQHTPDITVVEIADGILQRETKMLLESDYVRQNISGVMLAANCASSALFGLNQLQSLDHNVLCVSGLITSSPLFTREYVSHSDTPVITSADDGSTLADHIAETLATEQGIQLR